MTIVENSTRAHEVLLQNQIAVSPDILSGQDSEVVIALTSILQMPEGLLNSQASKKHYIIDTVQQGEVGLVAEAVASDAADHVGTMLLLNGIVHDSAIEMTDENTAQIQEAMNAQLLAACKAIGADLDFRRKGDSAALKNYLDEMTATIMQSIESGNLDENAEVDARAQFDEYSKLLSILT